MRILYLNPSGRLGGAETSLLGLLKALGELQPEWQLHLLLGEGGEVEARARSLGVRVHLLPLPGAVARSGDGAPGKLLGTAAALWAYRGRLAARIREIQPDLIHTNGFKMHLLGAWTAGEPSGKRPAKGTPVVCHLHDYVGSRGVTRRLMSMSAGRFSAVVANSESVADDVRKLPVRNGQVTAIHNGIDPEHFTPMGSAADLDRACGFGPAAEGTVRVGLVATFARWKGHLTFLQALSVLPDSLPIRAYMIGGPIYQTAGSQHSTDELRAEAKRLGIAEKVGFTGFIGDSAAAIRALDIVVHASTAPEPFGMVIIEAMACGRAVIASRAGGAAEIFEEDVDAMGHRPGDAVELAAQIELLVRDSELRARLGAAGRAKVLSRFRVEGMAGRFARVYRSVAAGAGVRDLVMERSA